MNIIQEPDRTVYVLSKAESHRLQVELTKFRHEANKHKDFKIGFDIFSDFRTGDKTRISSKQISVLQNFGKRFDMDIMVVLRQIQGIN